jgi:uncharacterized protein YcbK (DUF882 family)
MAHTDWPWKFFTPKEMADRSTGELQIDPAFLDRLDLLRSDFGRPLRILSAYRTPLHNAFVGGAPLSRHLTANAADISIVELEGGKTTLRSLAFQAGFRGFGYYRTFLHVDTGPAREWGKYK